MTEQLVDLADGRILAFRLVGDPGRDPVVVVHHGTPGGSLLDARWAAVARDLGVCLVGVARPGYGGSTPCEGRTVADVGRDVRDLLDGLGVERSAHVGWSGGGPHALATAAALGSRATRVATVGAIGPTDVDDLDVTAGMAEGNVEEIESGRDRQAEIADCKEAVAGFGDWTPERVMEAFGAFMGPEDQQVLTGDTLAWLATHMQDGVRAGVEGWADDGLALTSPWGFRLEDVVCPAWVVHGARDITVPAAHGRWLADHLGDARADFPPGTGHVGPLVTMTEDLLGWLRT